MLGIFTGFDGPFSYMLPTTTWFVARSIHIPSIHLSALCRLSITTKPWGITKILPYCEAPRSPMAYCTIESYRCKEPQPDSVPPTPHSKEQSPTSQKWLTKQDQPTIHSPPPHFKLPPRHSFKIPPGKLYPLPVWYHIQTEGPHRHDHTDLFFSSKKFPWIY